LNTNNSNGSQQNNFDFENTTSNFFHMLFIKTRLFKLMKA